MSKRPKVFYGWYIVAAATVQGFVNFGVFSLGQSLFVKDVRDEFSWGVAAISAGFSLRTLEQGLMAPFGGYLIDRFGSKIIAISGTIIQTIGLVMFATMEHLWQFYLSSFIVAFGQGLGGGQAFMNPVVFWFKRKRARASSIIVMGRAWAYVAVWPLAVLLTAFGWRTAALISAVVFIVVSLPSALLIRERPEPYGYLPDGDPVPTDGSATPLGGKAPPAEGFSVKEALRMRTFWLILIGNAVFSSSTQTHQIHILTHLRYTGFDVGAASLVAAMYGGVQVVGRLAVGWIGDYVGRTKLLVGGSLLMAVGWLVVGSITPAAAMVTLPLYYLTFGVGHSGIVVVQQTMVADYFGPRRFATLRGLMSPITVIGSVLGPLLAGLAFDHFGTFRPAFWAMAPIVAASGLAFLLAGKPKFAGDARKG